MGRTLKIDPEFQNKLPPLTDEEFRQLEENILDEGRVRNPIIVWNDTIVDGHNRYKVILKHPFVEWSVRDMKFADKWEALAWICKNQLGTRNMTEEQKTMVTGEMYKARKHSSSGAPVGNKNASKQCNQSDNIVLEKCKQNRVANQIAEELNISPASVIRAEMYVDGIEAIREEEPELADAIISSKKHVSKQTVRDIGQAHPVARKQMIDDIKNDRKKKITKAETKELIGIAETLTDDGNMEYTVDHLTEQIRINADAFIRSLSNMLMDHKDLCNEHQDKITKAIDESITERINQIKERLNNGTQL